MKHGHTSNGKQGLLRKIDPEGIEMGDMHVNAKEIKRGCDVFWAKRNCNPVYRQSSINPPRQIVLTNEEECARLIADARKNNPRRI
jgi:hypothetical protein